MVGPNIRSINTGHGTPARHADEHGRDMFFTHVNNVEDQEKLLATIIETKNYIRTQREKNRLHKEKLNLQYAALADPINKQLQSVIKPLPDPAQAPIPLKIEDQFIDDAQQGHSSDDVLNNDEKILPVDTNTQESVPPAADLTSYEKALQKIKKTNFDSNAWAGLNHNEKMIHEMPYSVKGNTLSVVTPTGVQTFEIKDDKTWQILLAKNPNELDFNLRQSNNLPIPALRKYRHIIDKLQILEKINEKNDPTTKMSQKYKLLQTPTTTMHHGTGGKIKKTRQHRFAPRPMGGIVIPSDPVGLLRHLRVLVSEFKAGNTDLLREIIPFTQEARRIGISANKLNFLKGIPMASRPL